MLIYVLTQEYRMATEILGAATTLKQAQRMATPRPRSWRQLSENLWDNYGQHAIHACELVTATNEDSRCGYCFSDDAVSCLYLANQHYDRAYGRDLACVCSCHLEEDTNETH